MGSGGALMRSWGSLMRMFMGSGGHFRGLRGHLWGLGGAYGAFKGPGGHCGVNFGVAMGSFRTILGVNLGDRFGIIMRSLLGSLICFGVTLGPFRIIWGSLWSLFWGHLGSFWGHVGLF